MSNTIIQIKRSTASNVPLDGSLFAAEQAYSFRSDKLFIGNTAGTGVIEIGGKYWVDTTQAAYNQANAAFEAANTGVTVSKAFEQANTARNQANSAYTQANVVFGQANSAFNQANLAFDQANTARNQANSAYTQANVVFGQANTARDQANSAYTQANVVFGQANSAYNQANLSFDKANIAYNTANIAWATANGKFSSNGGTITGSVSIVGNLIVSGNTSYISVQNYRVDDPLIYLAGNNYTSDIVDIGFIANYVNATGQNVHTGFFRDAGSKEYYAFYGYDQEPENNHIDPTANGFTLAVINADIRTSNLNLGGVNAISWLRNSYNQANSAYTQANLVFGQANTARDQANSAYTQANLAFDQANTARNQANSAYNQANTSYNQANLVFGQANTARDVANLAFSAANTANINGANASLLSTGTVPSARISGSYANITGVGIITAGTWNADIIKVPYGGTGVASFTTNGILYGNSAGDLKVTSAGTEGQVLQASATGVPQFGMLDGGNF